MLADLGEDDLVPGIKKLIIALYDHYVKLAINDPAGHADEITNQLKLDEFVDVAGTGTYQDLVKQLDVPATGCVALVTNQEDLQAANDTRLVTISVGAADQLQGADYQVSQGCDLRYLMLEKVWEDTHENK